MMWYAYTSIVIFLLFLLFVPKHLKLKEIYHSAGILGFGAWIGDALVGDVFKAFQLDPSPQTYLIDHIFISFVPLAIGIIYLNFLSVNKSILFKWGWVVFAFLCEWGAVASGYMINKGWQTGTLYLFLFLSLFFIYLGI